MAFVRLAFLATLAGEGFHLYPGISYEIFTLSIPWRVHPKLCIGLETSHTCVYPVA